MTRLPTILLLLMLCFGIAFTISHVKRIEPEWDYERRTLWVKWHYRDKTSIVGLGWEKHYPHQGVGATYEDGFWKPNYLCESWRSF
jgi:hypothetical protein